jgi:hypothetical protein
MAFDFSALPWSTYSERKHGEELASHEPGDVGGSDQSRETEEQSLHKNGKGELVVDMLDVMHQRWYETAANKLTSPGRRQSHASQSEEARHSSP